MDAAPDRNQTPEESKKELQKYLARLKELSYIVKKTEAQKYEEHDLLAKIGAIYDNDGNIAAAIRYVLRCVELGKVISGKYGFGMVVWLAVLYFKSRDNPRSSNWAKVARKLLPNTTGMRKGDIVNMYYILSCTLTDYKELEDVLLQCLAHLELELEHKEDINVYSDVLKRISVNYYNMGNDAIPELIYAFREEVEWHSKHLPGSTNHINAHLGLSTVYSRVKCYKKAAESVATAIAIAKEKQIFRESWNVMTERLTQLEKVIAGTEEPSYDFVLYRVCNACDKVFRGPMFPKCPCLLAYYCDEKCQNKDWPRHESECSHQDST